MVKTYLRFEQQDSFGVITSTTGDVLYLPGSDGKVAITATLEDVSFWNIKQGVLVDVLRDSDNKHCVTCMALDPHHRFLSVGYENGKIRVWDIKKREVAILLNAHNNAVTSLAYDITGALLASGSRDTEIVLWDIVAETGLCRLRGHKDEITDLKFIDTSVLVPSQDGNTTDIVNRRNFRCLISSSKDTFVKVWDVEMQQCVQTLTGHKGEVWTFDIMQRNTDNYALLVTGSNDKLLRAWKLHTILYTEANIDVMNIQNVFETKFVEFVGVLDRMGGAKRVHKLRFNEPVCTLTSRDIAGDSLPSSYKNMTGASVLTIQSLEKAMDVFTVRGKDDVVKRQKRRMKRFREKSRGQTADASGLDLVAPPEYLPSDDLEVQVPVRNDKKIGSFVYTPGSLVFKEGKCIGLKMLTSLHNNSLQCWNITLTPLIATVNSDQPAQSHEVSVKTIVDHAGHRSGVRIAQLSSDDTLLLTCSGNEMKFWNMKSHNCVRTIELAINEDLPANISNVNNDEVDDILGDVIQAACFVPGNRHALVGTKGGYVELYELSSGNMLAREFVHDGNSVWTLDLRPDGRGFISGGGKVLVTWDFELYETEFGTHKLGMTQTRSIQLADEVLCSKHSPDGRYVALGLINATVPIFHADTYNFYVNLIGHKLPVVTMDISSDSTLIITGSADKSAKLWGLDFADCRKSFRAHDNSVMKVQFQPSTHYFFTVGKDKLVKYWDGDKHSDILTLNGHHAEVWALCVASKGQFIVTGGNDRSIRKFEQTQSVVYVDEERKKRLEEEFDSNVKGSTDGSESIGELPGGIMKSAQDAVEAWKGVNPSKEALEFGERLIQCLDICDDEMENWRRWHKLMQIRQKEQEDLDEMMKNGNGLANMINQNGQTEVPSPTSHPLLQGSTPSQYVMKTQRSMKLAELQDTLITLPFEYAIKLFDHLSRLLEQNVEVEMCMKCAQLLLKIHQNQLISQRTHISVLANLKKHSRVRLEIQRETIGTNIAAAKYIAKDIEEAATANYFGEKEVTENPKKKKKYTTIAAKRRNKSYKHMRAR